MSDRRTTLTNVGDYITGYIGGLIPVVVIRGKPGERPGQCLPATAGTR